MTALRPFGVRVDGVAVDALDDETTAALRMLLAEHGVAVLADQHIDDHAFLRFLRSFGELMFTAGETPVDGFGDLNVVSNVGRTTPPRSQFHIDTSYVARPPAYTALRAVQVPAEGGATQFADQYRAHDTLPAHTRADLAGRTVTHVVTGLDAAGLTETTADHPLLRRHPLSGRTALYLSTPQRCAAVSGMTAEDGADLVRTLYDHSVGEDALLRHRWGAGDVVIWDNRVVMHRADHSAVVGDRVLHRGMVADPDPDPGCDAAAAGADREAHPRRT